ncbi:MAG TPA: ATP-binding cassette domain-containing protein [bacterium (Candidatus Stahlbacteria)]|nr:ATP-binding cassette domain-containing protein [Candidatus Stahlbacteria bacterium]
MRNEVAIRVEELTKYYGNILAVDRISFYVERGEIFGFLGPNGAGKTTTVRILTGILKPDEGAAFLLGTNIARDPVRAKQFISVVPEVSNVYGDLSAWQNLMLMGKLYGVSKNQRKEKAASLLEKLGLYERKDEKTRRFSKGMKQKLLVAMALINQPQVLFLDEPTSGLDVQSARFIRETIMELKRNGTTIFLTTHNIEEANLVCDRVAIINEGKVAAIDSPEKLKGTIQRTQSIEVAFDKMLTDLSWFEKIPKVNRIQRLGDKLRLYTEAPNDVICHLVEYGKANRLNFISLNTLGPSLEDVFVKLTEKG